MTTLFLSHNEQCDPFPNNLTADIIVTTVHGTWGRMGQLATSSSVFCKGLEEELERELGRAKVIIRPFRWSGRNNNDDRRIAACDLRRFIREAIDKLPMARHFIICHSHGGNIAFYAMLEDTFAAEISGVVTLSTPFIHIDRRPFSKEMRTIASNSKSSVVAGLGLLLALVVIRLINIELGGKESAIQLLWKFLAWLYGNTSIGEKIIWSVGLSTAMVFYFHIAQKLFGDKEDARGVPEFEISLERPNLTRKKFLIVRAVSDEASGVLIAFSFVNWILAKAWDLLSFLEKIVRPYLRRSAVHIFILALGCCEFLLPLARVVHGIGFLGAFVSALGGLSVAVGCISSICAFLLNIPTQIVRICSLPLAIACGISARLFGMKVGLWDAVEWRFSAEAYPPGGPWECYCVANRGDSSSAAQDGDRELMHALPYNDRNTLSHIAQWVLGRSGISGNGMV